MLKSRMLKIIPLPAFTDNYIWAIVYGNSCVVVDPGDSSPVFDFLESNNFLIPKVTALEWSESEIKSLKLNLESL